MRISKRIHYYFVGANTPKEVAATLKAACRTVSTPSSHQTDYITIGFHSTFEGQQLLHKYADLGKTFILFPLQPDLLYGYGLPHLDGYEYGRLPNSDKLSDMWKSALVLKEIEYEHDPIAEWTFPKRNQDNNWTPKAWIPVAHLRSFPRSLLRTVTVNPDNPKMIKKCGVPDFSQDPDDRGRYPLRMMHGLELLSLGDMEQIEVFIDGWALRFIPSRYLIWFALDRKIGTKIRQFKHEPEWVFNHLIDKKTMTIVKEGKLQSLVIHAGCKPRLVSDSLGIQRNIPWWSEVDIEMNERENDILLDTVREYIKRKEFDEYEEQQAMWFSECKWNPFFGSGYWSGKNILHPELGWMEEFVSAGTSYPSKERNPELRANRISTFDTDPAPSDWILGMTDDMRVPNWISGEAGILTNFLFRPKDNFTKSWTEEHAWKRLLSHQTWLEREAKRWTDLKLKCKLFGWDRSDYNDDLEDSRLQLLSIERELESDAFQILEKESKKQIKMKTDLALDLFGLHQSDKVIDMEKSLQHQNEVVLKPRNDLVKLWVCNLLDLAKSAMMSFPVTEDDQDPQRIEIDYFGEIENLVSIEKELEGDDQEDPIDYAEEEDSDEEDFVPDLEEDEVDIDIEEEVYA